MATTETFAMGDGTTTEFGFSFPYIKTEDVKVELQEYDATQTAGNQIISRQTITAFVVPSNNPTVVQFSSIGAATNYQAASGAPLANHAVSGLAIRVRIYRFTDADSIPATFIQGSAIRAQDLNDNFEQNLYIMQERQNTIVSIQTGGIGENVISTNALQDDSVDASKLRDSVSDDTQRAVTTNHIRDNAVTSAKIASVDSNLVTFDQSVTGSVSRTVESRLKDVISVKDFGAVGDGVADDTAAIQAAFNACQASGATLTFGTGVFLITQLTFTLTANLDVELAGGTIKGTNLATKMVTIKGGNTYGVAITGPGRIDGTQRIDIPSTGSGSGIVVERTTYSRISDVFFDGGGLKDGFGDSAIGASYGKDYIINNCNFVGWDDHDIYITGTAWDDVTNSPSTCVTISNCTFRDNGAGSIRIAREFSHVAITGNVFDNVGKAVVASGGATNANPGNSFTITGNVINKPTGTSSIDLRYFSNGVTISGNLIHDWGVGTDGNAINLRGVSNSTVVGNVIVPNDASLTEGCTAGIYLQAAVNPDLTPGEDGDPTYVWPSNYNIIANNVITVLDRGTGGPTSACITDNSQSTTNLFTNNKLNCGYGRYIYTQTGGTQRATDPQIIGHNANGLGIGTADPQALLDVQGTTRLSVNTLGDHIEIVPGTAAHLIKSYSQVNSAQRLFINATTDASNTTPTGGAVGLNLRVLNVDKVSCNVDDVTLNAPLKLKAYTTATLPTANILPGTIAYDNTTGTVKFYNGTVWANI